MFGYKTIDERVAALETRFTALQDVMLMHIAAAERFAPGLAQKTIKQSQVMANLHSQDRGEAVAKEIGVLLDQLRVGLDFPIND